MPLKPTMAAAPTCLAQLPNELTRGAGSDVAIITDDSKPELAIRPSELYDSMLETLEMLSDPQQVALLHSRLCDIAEGRTESWATVEANLQRR